MNYLTDKILRGTHRLYVNHYGSYLKPIDSIMDPEKASNIIYQQLKSDSPSMVARYGSTEILCVNNYLGIKKYKQIKYPNFGGIRLAYTTCNIFLVFFHLQN